MSDSHLSPFVQVIRMDLLSCNDSNREQDDTDDAPEQKSLPESGNEYIRADVHQRFACDPAAGAGSVHAPDKYDGEEGDPDGDRYEPFQADEP